MSKKSAPGVWTPAASRLGRAFTPTSRCCIRASSSPPMIFSKSSIVSATGTSFPFRRAAITRPGAAMFTSTRASSRIPAASTMEPVRVAFDRNTVGGISSLKDGHQVDKAALEPELLTSILSDQLENPRPATLNQIPQHLQDAVIVTEDVRFWPHPGIDPLGILRAAFRNLRAAGAAEGASTLTQQLVKNYYLTPEKTMKRKVVEALMAIILDAKYTKPEIPDPYLNDLYPPPNRSIHTT